LKDLAPPLLLHSRFRPADRAKLAERLREPVPADSAGRIVVATQTIEAGVDISARTLFTELCPWSSLVQRCGRCNREGEWGIEAPAQVYWIDVSSGKSDDFLPYKEEHLARTREVLAGLSDAGIESLDGAAEPEEPPVTQVLRRRDIVDLFDTTPDLAGNDIDVSPYIRDSDDLDVQVFWRTFGEDGKPEDDRPPAPEELCAVRLPEFRKFLDRASAEGRGVLLWDPLAGAWAPLRDYQLRPGLAILLDAAAGGYEADLGWWPSAKKPSVVPVIVPAPGTSSEAYEDDPTTPLTRAVSIADHHDHVVAQLRALCGALPELASDDLEALLLAARWHDAGKAHPSFQQRLTARLPEDDPRREGPILAKTPKCWYGRGAGRPYFRHELASALAMLQSGLPQLAVYLAAAHHGKVRLSIRSLPDERPPEDRPQARVARGVWEGDVLPEAELGDAVRMPETVLSLAPMELGECEGEPSWLARALALREALGPFRLAWLEALLRVADWRASEEEEKGCD